MVLIFLKLTVANQYYNQPLLETMRQSLGATELQANLITFITQLGYALGLVFVFHWPTRCRAERFCR